MNALQLQKKMQTNSVSSARRGKTPFFEGIALQRKLTIGSANDAYEQEADRVADQVVKMDTVQTDATPTTGALVQRKCAACEHDEHVQKKPLATTISPLIQKTAAATGTDGGTASNAITNQINASKGNGHTMDNSTQHFMESRFGNDFSGVRIHTGSQAIQMSRDLNAQAFTVGNDIYFNEGKYNPDSTQGKHLLAHELTHTIQQKGIQRKIQRAEVDDSAATVNCPTLAESKTALNSEVNRILAASRTALSIQFSNKNPNFVGPPSIDGTSMVAAAYQGLGAPHLPHLAIIENWANSNLTSSGGGNMSRSGTRYNSIPWGYIPIFSYLAPVVKLNGICAGTDKIGHMFQQGFQYFFISSSAGLGKGDAYAKAWGEWMEGKLSASTRSNTAIMRWLNAQSSGSAGPVGIGGQPQGHFGLLNTGVHSRGDLAANESGLRFYRDLFNNPYMTFDISNYVVADWNEETSGNMFENSLGTSIRSAGHLHSSDTVLP